MKLSVIAACAASASAFVGAANASTVVVSPETFSPVIVVDSSTASATTTVASSGLITDVDISIDVTACDDPISSSGDCVGTGFSFNSELTLQLVSPSGTMVDLVIGGTFSGQSPGARATLTFDDDALTPVGGSSLLTGTFNPVELLTTFNGEDAAGIWTVIIGDTVGADPKSLNGFTLTVTTAPVPLPAAAALFVPAIGAMAAVRRRRRAS